MPVFRMNKSCLEAAAEAAAKVNALLIAKGKLKLPPSQVKPKISSSGRSLCGDLIIAEIDINDAPLTARNLLTRGHTQEEICKLSGATTISTRGRYMTLEERQNISTPDCRPLYLHIQAPMHEAVSLAVKRIQEIINQHVIVSGVVKSSTVGVVTYPTSNLNGTSNAMMSLTSAPLSSGPHFVQDKVFVGLEQAPPNYPVREKILGPGGSFLQHIRTETAANVTLRGKGSGFIEPTSGREAFEPLYIHVTHPKLEGLQAAKALAINLVETAHVEFAQWQQQQQQHRTVIQPIVIPQATPLAYQNQGVSLPQSVSHLVQAPVSGVPPVSVVSSIPVSVQGVHSQAVITYPTTYIASHNSTVPVARAVPAVSSIVGMVPRLPVSAAYSIATSQQALVSSQTGALPIAQYPASVQTFTLSQPLTYAAVPTSQAHITQAVLPQQSVVVAPNPVSYSTMPATYISQPAVRPMNIAPVSPVVSMPVVQTVSTAYPHIQYTRAGVIEQVKGQYYEQQDINKNAIPDSRQSLQESNSNPSIENGAQSVQQMQQRFLERSTLPGSQDRDLMPPPILNPFGKGASSKRGISKSDELVEPDRKKLRGALIGLASTYGSDDSSDDESPVTGDSSPHSKSYAASHSNKPLM